MKTIISILALTSISLLGFSGGKSEKIHEEFASKQGVVSMTFSKEMLEAFDLDFDWQKALMNFSGDFAKIKILFLSGQNAYTADIQKRLKKYGYKQVDLEGNNEADLQIYTDKKRKEFNEIHLMSTGEGSGMLISVFGKFVITDKQDLK
ncbi:MAG: DUF4252 domain-containing protein [Salibacteraceae bacterium]